MKRWCQQEVLQPSEQIATSMWSASQRIAVGIRQESFSKPGVDWKSIPADYALGNNCSGHHQAHCMFRLKSPKTAGAVVTQAAHQVATRVGGKALSSH